MSCCTVVEQEWRMRYLWLRFPSFKSERRLADVTRFRYAFWGLASDGSIVMT
ncbi:unnamed protein product [Chondrus crispus]|uniref:Uncharacterized protein n=1 Tax=Chondrus crispus TaxID=2769 RepID=R7QMZ4_CHOCR|nr:unnamed protein product [Chondrus crispus]XP_005718660.1 unnamed protein product [Chondrus crispus]CDF38388.1 unnamed protein product [Chondrus crispus]CDF38755.1 unnamed protein product [Chondrus crispus]|eukprot:XP_005718281.1 unnamed protein product [Chondrus crispus]